MAHNPAAFQDQSSRTGSIPAPVSSSHCVPYVAEFVIDQKVFTLSSGKFSILDKQGQLLFDVKGKIHPLHKRRILRDAFEKTLVLMKKKNWSVHERWEAYRGEDESALLFSMAKSSVWQFKPSFDIFLPTNTSQVPDFTIKGNLFEHNYVIKYGDVPAAEVKKKINGASIFMGKDQYGVIVHPGVDHVFVAAVIVIVDQVQQDERAAANGAGA